MKYVNGKKRDGKRMKQIRDILDKLFREEISIDEAEGEIDFIIMSGDCPK